jgi:hypothetical protein
LPSSRETAWRDRAVPAAEAARYELACAWASGCQGRRRDGKLLTPHRRLAIDRATWESFLRRQAEGSGQRRRKGRGPKRRFDPQTDQEIAEAWRRAHAATGIAKKDYAAQRGMSFKDLERLLNRVRRPKNGPPKSVD